MDKTPRYNVAFEYTEAAGGYKGVRTWTSYKDKEDFHKHYNDKMRALQRVIAEGISDEEAIKITSEIPLRCYAAAAVQEATMPDGSLNEEILDMEARNLAIVRAFGG